MPKLTEEMLREAVKNCKWRQNFCGTDICSGNCNICAREIEAGRCDTLSRLVAEYSTKEAEEHAKRVFTE